VADVCTRPEPVTLTAKILTLDKKGEPHAAGTVVRDGDDAYVVETSGAFRRVQIVEETLQGVRYRHIKAVTKAEKKARKRARARARAALADAALRVARRALQAEALHG